MATLRPPGDGITPFTRPRPWGSAVPDVNSSVIFKRLGAAHTQRKPAGFFLFCLDFFFFFFKSLICFNNILVS